MITSSIHRIRKYGALWCPAGNDIADAISDKFELKDKDELPIHKLIEDFPLDVYFLAMANPHPKYAAQAEKLMTAYGEHLVRLLKDELTFEESTALLNTKNRPQRKRHLLTYWYVKRNLAQGPRERAITECVVCMLLGYHPAHNMMLATKQYLNIAALDGKLASSIEDIKDWIRERSNAA